MSHQTTNSNDPEDLFLSFIPPVSPHLPRQYKHPLQIPQYRDPIQLVSDVLQTAQQKLPKHHHRFDIAVPGSAADLRFASRARTTIVRSQCRTCSSVAHRFATAVVL